MPEPASVPHHVHLGFRDGGEVNPLAYLVPPARKKNARLVLLMAGQLDACPRPAPNGPTLVCCHFKLLSSLASRTRFELVLPT